MPEMQSTGPSIIEDAQSYLGLNYSPPVGFSDNMAEISKIPGDVRNAVSWVTSFGQ